MSVTITRVNKAIRHSLTVESTQSNPFMRLTFHQLFSEETFVGVLLYRASLESRNNVPYCTPPLPVSVYPIPSTLPPALDLHPNRCGRAAVSQQETLMRCTTELALTTIPPSVLFPFCLPFPLHHIVHSCLPTELGIPTPLTAAHTSTFRLVEENIGKIKRQARE